MKKLFYFPLATFVNDGYDIYAGHGGSRSVPQIRRIAATHEASAFCLPWNRIAANRLRSVYGTLYGLVPDCRVRGRKGSGSRRPAVRSTACRVTSAQTLWRNRRRGTAYADCAPAGDINISRPSSVDANCGIENGACVGSRKTPVKPIVRLHQSIHA